MQELVDDARTRVTEAGFDVDDEGSVLELATSTSDKYLRWYAVLALRPIATGRSIPALRELLAVPHLDLKISALCLLSDLAGPRLSHFYLELLDDSRFPARWAAMRAVSAHCGSEAVPSVVRKVRGDAGKAEENRRREGYQPDSRLVLGCRHLARHVDAFPEAAEALRYVADRWQFLFPPEQRALADSVPGFPPGSDRQ